MLALALEPLQGWSFIAQSTVHTWRLKKILFSYAKYPSILRLTYLAFVLRSLYITTQCYLPTPQPSLAANIAHSLTSWSVAVGLLLLSAISAFPHRQAHTRTYTNLFEHPLTLGGACYYSIRRWIQAMEPRCAEETY